MFKTDQPVEVEKVFDPERQQTNAERHKALARKARNKLAQGKKPPKTRAEQLEIAERVRPILKRQREQLSEIGPRLDRCKVQIDVATANEAEAIEAVEFIEAQEAATATEAQEVVAAVDEALYEKTYVQPNPGCRHDRDYTALKVAEKNYENAPPEERMLRQHDVVKAEKKFAKTKEYLDTDAGRKQDLTDKWRAGEGKEIFNAGRRKRKESNDELRAMSPEDRKARDNAMAAERKRKGRAKMKAAKAAK